MDQPATPFSIEWWTESLGSWMAWNRVTVLFFIYVFGSIALMGLWEWFSPGGGPRHGIFRLNTTRGDRLFMTHLGSCFIFLAWLGIYGMPLWGGLILAIFWALFIFRWA